MQYYFVYYLNAVLRVLQTCAEKRPAPCKKEWLMSVTEVFLIGIALAADAFALTVANCATYKSSLDKLKEWAMPTAFSVFQFAMPVAGFYIGSIFSSYLATFSKYLTAGIFFVLAIKIVIDNVKETNVRNTVENGDKTPKNEGIATSAAKDKNGGNFTFGVLILQAVATSIDALAVGVTFSVELSFSVFAAAAIIGGVTFAVVTAALFIGKYLGNLLGKYATWVGAAILFILAVKNLADAIA